MLKEEKAMVEASYVKYRERYKGLKKEKEKWVDTKSNFSNASQI